MDSQILELLGIFGILLIQRPFTPRTFLKLGLASDIRLSQLCSIFFPIELWKTQVLADFHFLDVDFFFRFVAEFFFKGSFCVKLVFSI